MIFAKTWECVAVHIHVLTLCGLVTPYGDIDLGQHWPRMACCLTAPSHYLNQCWLIISEVLRHSHEGNFFTGNTKEIYQRYALRNINLRLQPHLTATNELKQIYRCVLAWHIKETLTYLMIFMNKTPALLFRACLSWKHDQSFEQIHCQSPATTPGKHTEGSRQFDRTIEELK